ncbi:Hypothetical_protein [Hexamita inflata]|uniref:Hypothetical_protein n=1 Tax=Hexamita inflata TaxID=28002 RepID=A0AA86NSR9_9EUKA|nr:Hypothetical protein HINF_LOCUS12129 [Hexamita inflata]
MNMWGNKTKALKIKEKWLNILLHQNLAKLLKIENAFCLMNNYKQNIVKIKDETHAIRALTEQLADHSINTGCQMKAIEQQKFVQLIRFQPQIFRILQMS